MNYNRQILKFNKSILSKPSFLSTIIGTLNIIVTKNLIQ